jgi:hypothetical protein
MNRNQPILQSNEMVSNVNYQNSVWNGTTITISRIISYLVAITIVVFIILLFVHYFIRPIFRFSPGAPGIITVPGWDDGVVFWKDGNTGTIANNKLPISQMFFGYSMIMDVFVENPFQFSNHHRLLCSRGGTRRSSPAGDTLLGSIQQYNIAVALLPDTNDMVVSVLNIKNNMENIVVPNIPVQEPFRLGIILMENALEVYINGHLVRTRTFLHIPLDVKGDIQQASGIESNVAKVRNLKIWPRILTTSEIREATPSLSSVSDFGAGPIPSSTACSSDLSSSSTCSKKRGINQTNR